MSNASSGFRNRAVPLLAGLAVGGLFAWLAIRGADLQDVGRILSTRLDMASALAALLTYLLYFVLKSLRWRLILAPVMPIGTGALFPYVMVGYLGNLAVPFQLGEAYRGYLLSRDRSINAVTALSSIFLEKVFDLLVVVGLALAAVQFVSKEVPFLAPVREWFLWISLAGLLMFVAVLAQPERAAAMARRLLDLLPSGRLFDGLRTVLKHAAQGLAVLTSGTQAMLVLVVSVLSWLLMLATLYFCLLAVGLTGPVSMAAIILFLTVLGLTLPTSPGFVGTIQIAFVTGAQLFAIGQEHALAASIFYNMIITLPPVVVGVVCIIFLHRRRRVAAP